MYVYQVHIIETHVPEFLLSKADDCGLGFRSEQAFECTHHDFSEELKKVGIIKKENNATFMLLFQQGSVTFDSKDFGEKTVQNCCQS